MALSQCDDPQLVAWLTDNLADPSPPFSTEDSWLGIRVEHVLPSHFDGYWKILHAIYEDLDVEDRGITWDEFERLGPRATPEESSVEALLSSGILLSSAPDGPFHGRRVTWRELAERYGLTLHEDFSPRTFLRGFGTDSWPRYLVAPPEASLDDETCKGLVDVLSMISPDSPAYFWWDGLSLADYEPPETWIGRVVDVLDLTPVQRAFGTPTRWWPADRLWALYSDWDLQFSILAGPKELGPLLIADQRIEVLPVRLESRIDDYSDRNMFSDGGRDI